MIPKHKWGDCTQCDSKDVPAVKVGKDLVCLVCHRRNKGRTQIQKANEKSKIRGLISSPANKSVIVKRDVELDLWFIDRSKEMTGKCRNCGGKSCKGDPKYWKYSICHILPKAKFPSVAKHPLNFVELCYFGNSCHSNFDNNGFEYAREKMPLLWNIISTRVKAMFPSVRERSKIVDVLIQEIDIP